MTHASYRSNASGFRGRVGPGIALFLFMLLVAAVFANSSFAAQAPVALGIADSFGVLSATGATTVGATVINGDLGSAGAITGPFVVNGVNYGAAGLTPGARADLGTAYTLSLIHI